jgi:spore coat polysaccharide biosynthesis protein SpsF (cytidylyltransferase family)
MIGVLITARMGSGRLAKKHILKANGKPLLYWLIKRFEFEFEKEINAQQICLIIATSEKPENKDFTVVTQNTSCQIFQGSDDNIPLRHLQCAQHFNLSHVISVDGDDILCSTHASRTVFEQMIKNTEHTSFSTSGLPIGMNVGGYTTSYLEECIKTQSGKKLETGWGRIFKNPITWEKSLGKYDIMGDLRFTLDYPEDAVFFCEVINRLKEKIISVPDEELINFVEENNLDKINASLKDVYWGNYNSEKQKEIDNEQK